MQQAAHRRDGTSLALLGSEAPQPHSVPPSSVGGTLVSSCMFTLGPAAPAVPTANDLE